MRYIALNEDAEPVSDPVPRSDGSIKDEVCLNVMSALISLQYAALRRRVIADSRDCSHWEFYYKGRAEAFKQAVEMLRGILSGEFSSQSSTPEDICKMTEEK